MFAVNARAQVSDDVIPPPTKEDDRLAPVDWGYGLGVRQSPNMRAVREMMTGPAAAPAVGAAEVQNMGAFGPVVPWPLIAIHAVLLPDGRVMNYGTNERGQQGAELVYDVWDPKQGTNIGAHTVLPNTTSTDIFCGAQSVIAGSGEVLITGGDKAINGQQHFSDQATAIFNSSTNQIRPDAPMLYARWYPTIVALSTGEMLVLGGREDQLPDVPVPIPEVFTQNLGWRTLWGATSDAAFGSIKKAWWYPRAVQAPNGKVFVLGHDGKMFYLDPAGNGAITELTQQTLPSTYAMPSVMFAPGRVLAVRSDQNVVIVDLNGPEPAIAPTANISQKRVWASGTVLADGKVLLTGGSAVPNQLTGVAYAAEIWDPATGQWTLGANAANPRLYHSTALLLPDGSVLTAGGGAPGPVKNLNAEIYYPGYLYDGSGQPAARPSLVAAPGVVRLHLNQQFPATVGSADPISRVTLVRTGSVTHSLNPDQRFLELGFTQAGQALTIALPTTDPNVVLPGYYMLFVFDQAGVPSVASIVLVLT
jgi:hypothetical protein